MAGSKSVPMACTPLGASNCWAHQWLGGHHLQKPSGSDGLHESAHREKPALAGPGSSHFEGPSVTCDALADDILCKHSGSGPLHLWDLQQHLQLQQLPFSSPPAHTGWSPPGAPLLV